MKSLLLSTVFFFASMCMFAQSLSVKLHGRQPNYAARMGNPDHTNSTSDTIDVYILRATGATFYQASGGGYVFGTSFVYDTSSTLFFPVTDETGLDFDGIGSATVTDILFFAGAKHIMGNPDNITGRIYTVGSDSMPVTEVGSGIMSMQDVDTSLSTAVFTDLPITTGSGNITSGFFVSVSYEGNDDTLGFVSTKSGDGLMEKRIRQKAGAAFGGAWKRMGELYPFLDVDLFIAPIVTLSNVGVNDHFTFSNATLDAVYPTIASAEIHVDYTLKSNSLVSYFLFDLKGKKYFELKGEQQQAGTYSQAFDVSALAAGNYFLTVNIEGHPVTQKVVITK
jgi:hypothetical protein